MYWHTGNNCHDHMVVGRSSAPRYPRYRYLLVGEFCLQNVCLRVLPRDTIDLTVVSRARHRHIPRVMQPLVQIYGVIVCAVRQILSSNAQVLDLACADSEKY